MAKIKNVSGEDRVVPALGDRLVLKGAVVDVPDDAVYGYTQQDAWAAADDDAQTAHAAAERDYRARVGIPPETPGVEPGGNASREEWVGYVLAAGLAVEDDLTDLGRDAIRDTYSTKES